MSRSRLYLGQKIMVSALPDGEPFKSMIQELDDKKLAFSLPFKSGQYLLLHEGDKVKVEFVHKDAVYSFIGEILERKKVNNVSLLVLPRPTLLSRRQRRQYVRLPLVMPLQIRVAKEDSSEKVIRGKVVDLSGGGLQFVSKEALPVNTEVTFTLPLGAGEKGKQHLAVKCVINWVFVDRATKDVRIGIQFAGISEAEREQIIAYIFRELRKRISPP